MVVAAGLNCCCSRWRSSLCVPCLRGVRVSSAGRFVGLVWTMTRRAGSTRPRRQRAVPPPDNPFAREQGRAASRVAGEQDLQLVSVGDGVRVAISAVAMQEPAARRAGAKRSTAAQMAELRLAALAD